MGFFLGQMNNRSKIFIIEACLPFKNKRQEIDLDEADVRLRDDEVVLAKFVVRILRREIGTLKSNRSGKFEIFRAKNWSTFEWRLRRWRPCSCEGELDGDLCWDVQKRRFNFESYSVIRLDYFKKGLGDTFSAKVVGSDFEKSFLSKYRSTFGENWETSNSNIWWHCIFTFSHLRIKMNLDCVDDDEVQYFRSWSFLKMISTEFFLKA